MSRTSRTSANRCPVPHEQRPLNEFAEMKEAWLFSWLTLPVAVYVRKLLIVWAINWVLVGWPIAAVSYPPAKAPGH
ncbi:MAG: CGLD27 family protein, partial [Cyanobacteria bacterium P01_H01_bin.130]